MIRERPKLGRSFLLLALFDIQQNSRVRVEAQFSENLHHF
jgi:hypothetical protein